MMKQRWGLDRNVLRPTLMSWTCMLSFSFIPLMASEEKSFEYFFENLCFMLPRQPINFSDLDNLHMNRRGLLKKHSCRKKNQNFCSETAKIATFHFSHYKSMGTIRCHSNQSSYAIGTKTQLFVPLTYRRYMGNMERIGFTASEEKSFENVDGRTDDGRPDDDCLPIL